MMNIVISSVGFQDVVIFDFRVFFFFVVCFEMVGIYWVGTYLSRGLESLLVSNR
jgi:hypothetical protein